MSDGERNTGNGEAGDETERLVDQALREMTRPPVVDVKAPVMAAWDARAAAAGAATEPSRWWNRPWLLKPTMALAGTLAIVIGLALTWYYTEGLFRRAERLASQAGVGRTAARETSRSPQRQEPAVRAGDTQRAPEPATPGESRLSRRPRSNLTVVTFAAEDLAAGAESPHLPGAPAGELGDPLEPLPNAPRIAIAPISTAPPVSDMARPVSEFPAVDNPPAEANTEAGPTQGEQQ